MTDVTMKALQEHLQRLSEGAYLVDGEGDEYFDDKVKLDKFAEWELWAFAGLLLSRHDSRAPFVADYACAVESGTKRPTLTEWRAEQLRADEAAAADLPF